MTKQELITILNNFVEDCISQGKIESLKDFLSDKHYSANNIRSIERFLASETVGNRSDSYRIIKRFVSSLCGNLGFNTMIDLYCLKSDLHRVTSLVSQQKHPFGYELFESLDLKDVKLRIYMHQLCKKGKVQRIERGLFLTVNE